ncbi:MAG TPA: DinB family protein [Metabacillus sp.]|nr:DinB family protein [Metabacillus sp.]
MLKDLYTEERMAPTVRLFFAMVEENYTRLCSSIENIPQNVLDYKGKDGQYNSIAQLIRHLAYVDLRWAYRIKGEPIPDTLEKKYGPMIDEKGQLPPVSGLSIDQLLQDYDEVYQHFRRECLRLKDKDLKVVVDYEDGKKATIQWGIWHMADHSRYHQAHINLILKEKS